MKSALKEAEKAFDDDEVPVGAVMVHDHKIIAWDYNRMKAHKNPLLHAEMNVMAQALQKGYDLRECEIFVTLEPCSMCAGAIELAHIKRLYFGAYDFKMGQVDHNYKILSHCQSMEVYGGFFEKECSVLLKRFFKNKRI